MVLHARRFVAEEEREDGGSGAGGGGGGSGGGGGRGGGGQARVVAAGERSDAGDRAREIGALGEVTLVFAFLGLASRQRNRNSHLPPRSFAFRAIVP